MASLPTRNAQRAERKIRALQDAIQVAIAHGIGVSANIVVPNASHVPRVHRLLTEYSPFISVRLLNSLDDGEVSIEAIHKLLVDLKAVPIGISVTAGASGWRTAYRLPSGRVVYFKQIRPVRLPETCAGCRFNNGTDCEEGYYGVRLYRDRDGGFQVGVCIQRMDLCLPVEEFVRSDLRKEILSLREAEFRKLATKYGAEVPIEFEAKSLDVEPDELADRILRVGGRRMGDRLMRRYVYDIRTGDESRWIRLRDDGTATTLTVKEIAHDGTTETEVVVSDFEVTDALLGRIGFQAKSYQENRRVSFELQGAQLEIDWWPLIPPYLEIEGQSREHVVRVGAALGIAENELTGENTVKVYARYGIDLTEIRDLRFPE
jgi:adenylate cyclase class IV